MGDAPQLNGPGRTSRPDRCDAGGPSGRNILEAFANTDGSVAWTADHVSPAFTSAITNDLVVTFDGVFLWYCHLEIVEEGWNLTHTDPSKGPAPTEDERQIPGSE